MTRSLAHCLRATRLRLWFSIGAACVLLSAGCAAPDRSNDAPEVSPNVPADPPQRSDVPDELQAAWADMRSQIRRTPWQRIDQSYMQFSHAIPREPVRKYREYSRQARDADVNTRANGVIGMVAADAASAVGRLGKLLHSEKDAHNRTIIVWCLRFTRDEKAVEALWAFLGEAKDVDFGMCLNVQAQVVAYQPPFPLAGVETFKALIALKGIAYMLDGPGWERLIERLSKNIDPQPLRLDMERLKPERSRPETDRERAERMMREMDEPETNRAPSRAPGRALRRAPIRPPEEQTASSLLTRMGAAHGLAAWRKASAVEFDLDIRLGPLTGKYRFARDSSGHISCRALEGGADLLMSYDGQAIHVSPPEALADFPAPPRFHLLTWPFLLAAPFELSRADEAVLRPNREWIARREYDVVELRFDTPPVDTLGPRFVAYLDAHSGRLEMLRYRITHADMGATDREHAIGYLDFETHAGLTTARGWRFYLWDADRGSTEKSNGPIEELGGATVSNVQLTGK